MRRALVAANWKMNLDLPQMRAWVAAARAELTGTLAVDVVVCPPFPYLFPMAKALAECAIRLGAQDAYHETSGAFTGEVSAVMVRETGAAYVILGHSERRHTIGHLEDDRMVNLKLRAVQSVGMTPILCVGETLAQRKASQTLDVLSFQLSAGLSGVRVSSGEQLVIAYEPVWAIGTGLNATAAQAQEAHAHLRAELTRLIGREPAAQVRIIYGGSLKPENANELMGQADVDGGLVGGASLKAETFTRIVRVVSQSG
ncbi:MAG: Bifunctional PGK/TIM [Phycisphaerae bacterium]|nr:Bifunctional PGK/TIM [Phycisphaerae bacterium]